MRQFEERDHHCAVRAYVALSLDGLSGFKCQRSLFPDCARMHSLTRSRTVRVVVTGGDIGHDACVGGLLRRVHVTSGTVLIIPVCVNVRVRGMPSRVALPEFNTYFITDGCLATQT